MLAKPQSEPPARHPAFEKYRAKPDAVTEFRQTWAAKYGHRWVLQGGKYYPVGTPEHLRTNKRGPYRRHAGDR